MSHLHPDANMRQGMTDTDPQSPIPSPQSPIPILHLVDTLEAGGAERMAVNLVNHLPRAHYQAYLCTTRREGPLSDLVSTDVGRLSLARTRRIDLGALRRLVAFVRRHHIQILHAHGTALFTAVLAGLFSPGVRLIWHVHFGRYATESRSAPISRLLVRRTDGVIAVNQPLADWARRRLQVSAARVWYLPNFVETAPAENLLPELPGLPGERIVCVANLRPEKNHTLLVQAMAAVVARRPTAHLLLVGAAGDPATTAAIQQQIQALGLAMSVTWLGRRDDVAALLAGCDIGVLSSASEGLPLALLEYGMAGLAAVATDVGQCAEVLDHGAAGLLVPPNQADALADALLALLTDAPLRQHYAQRLHQRVQAVYSADAAIPQLVAIYRTVLDG